MHGAVAKGRACGCMVREKKLLVVVGGHGGGLGGRGGFRGRHDLEGEGGR